MGVLATAHHRWRLRSALLLLIGGCLPALNAATVATIQVSATVTAGCLVAGGASNFGTLNFGNYSALASTTATAQLLGIALQCTPGVTVNMMVDGGQNNNGGRRLQRVNSTHSVGYQLYSDPAFTQILGINQSVTMVYSDAANISLPIYGRVVLPGSLPAGQYSDVLQITLTW